MLTLVDAGNREAHAGLLQSMFVDRKAVFVDYLKWDLEHEDGRELDAFDDVEAQYLILQGPCGRHLGSVRLLSTEGPHLLRDVFPFMCDSAVPTGPHIREITRLCVAPDCPSDQRGEITRMLCTALVDHALLHRIETYTAITDVAFMARVLAAGWSCRPLGLPRAVGDARLCALRIDIDQGTPELLRRTGRYRPVPMRLRADQRA